MTDTQTWRNILSDEDFERIPDLNSLVSIAIQPQYAHSVRLGAFCKLFQDEIDATPQLASLLEMIADPETARGVFLDWWGVRVGADRHIQMNGENVRLDDDTYRFLIFYRALANISDASAATMNTLLKKLIGLPVFIVDNMDMTVSVHVLGNPSDLQVVILSQYGLLTRGAGVGYNIVVQNPDTQIFGFDGSKLMPFDQGVFNPARTLHV